MLFLNERAVLLLLQLHADIKLKQQYYSTVGDESFDSWGSRHVITANLVYFFSTAISIGHFMWIYDSAMESQLHKPFSVDGIVALITGGGTGKRPVVQRCLKSLCEPHTRVDDGKGTCSQRRSQGLHCRSTNRSTRGCSARVSSRQHHPYTRRCHIKGKPSGGRRAHTIRISCLNLLVANAGANGPGPRMTYLARLLDAGGLEVNATSLKSSISIEKLVPS